MTLILHAPVDDRYERLRGRLTLSLNHLNSSAQRGKWDDARGFLARCRREVWEMRAFEKECVIVGDPKDLDILTHLLSRVDLLLDTIEAQIEVLGTGTVRTLSGIALEHCRMAKQAAYRVEMHALPPSVEDL